MKMFLILIIILATRAFAATKEEELEKRIEQLERSQDELLLHVGALNPQVSSFLNDSLKLGGYFEPGYTFITGKDTDTQAATSNILALNIASDYGSNYHFSAQTLSILGISLQNPHNDPRLKATGFSTKREFKTPVFATTLVQGYVQKRNSRLFNIQAGLGYVPFGYAFQEREVILFLRRGGPQMLRYGGVVISPLWEGVNLLGSTTNGKHTIGYNAYTFSSPEKINALGGGGRVWIADSNESLKAGLSAQTTKSATETYETLGADIKVEEGAFLMRAEYFQSFFKEEDTWSGYVEPAVKLLEGEIILYVFGDYLFNPKNKTNNVLLDPIQRWEYGGGVNWLPTSFTRYRLGITYNDYVGARSRLASQSRDFWSFDLSAGVAF